MFGMANGHLQRDEAAIAIAEHDRVFAAAASFTASAIRSATAARPPVTACEPPKPGNSGTITRNDFDKFGNDGVKTRAVRQQRMEQKQRRPLAGLRGVDGAVGEKPIHPVSLSNASKRVRLARQPPIDRSKSAEFKPLLLT